MAENSIVFSTALDNKQLVKDLNNTKKLIEKEAGTVSKQEAAKAPLVEQADELRQRLRAAREEAERYKTAWANGVAGADKDHSNAIAKTKELEAQHAKVVEQIDKIDNKLLPAQDRLDELKAKAGELEAELAKSGKAGAELNPGLARANKSMDKLLTRVKGLARRVMVFSVITMGLRQLRTWMTSAVKSNSDATAAIARLQGALLTMVQPLLDVVIPAFTAFVNVLANLASALAQVTAKLFGTTVEQSAAAAENLRKEQKALEGVSGAAKKSSKSMASFDEINKLSAPSDAGGGGSKGVTPDFSFVKSAAGDLESIAESVIAIGAGLALWKIGESLPGVLGAVATNLGLILVAVGGLVLAWDGLTDAWENGVDWLNLAEMIGGVALAAWALYSAFGSVGAGITLVVGGIAMLVTGFKDAFENGFTLQSTLLAIAGIVATGLGLSFLTQSVIPALIGAIGGILLAITVATGHGGELLQGLQTIFSGLTGFVKGAIEGDWATAFASLGTAFEGVGMVFDAVISGVRDLFVNFLTWLDEKTGGKLHDIIETLIISIDWIYTSVKEVLDGIIDVITGVFTGDWEKAWNGLVKIMDGILGAMLTPFVAVLNLIIDGLNALIRGLNKIQFNPPDWVPGIGGKTFGVNIQQLPKIQVPKLAEGAVIPPNREFMAVLGDQRSGNNLEAPEGLLRQIVREEAGGNYTSLLMQILAAIKEDKVMMVDNDIFAQVVREADQREGDRQGVPLVTVR